MPETLNPIDHTLVTVGQPTEGGCVWVSFAENPTLPTDAVTKMSTLEGFESVGDLSANGFTESESFSVTKHNNWNLETIATSATDTAKTAKMEFVEVNRPSVAKIRYGAANVEVGTDGSVSHIVSKGPSFKNVALVIDELESNGYLRRTVIPKARPESFDDIVHQKGSLLVYGATFTELVGADGEYTHTYRAQPSA